MTLYATTYDSTSQRLSKWVTKVLDVFWSFALLCNELLSSTIHTGVCCMCVYCNHLRCVFVFFLLSVSSALPSSFPWVFKLLGLLRQMWHAMFGPYYRANATAWTWSQLVFVVIWPKADALQRLCEKQVFCVYMCVAMGCDGWMTVFCITERHLMKLLFLVK